MVGWGWAARVWLGSGFVAGVDPGFILALTAGCTFTITACHSIVMPDKVKLYGLGFRDGVEHADAAQHRDPEPSRRLTAVR